MHELRDLRHHQVDHQVTPSPEDDQRHDEQPDRDLDDPPRRRVAHAPGDAVDARQVDVAHPPHDGVVDDDDGDRRARDTVAEDQHGDDDGDDRGDEPAGPGRAQMTGQRRRCARRASPRCPSPEAAGCYLLDGRPRRVGRRLAATGHDHLAHHSTAPGTPLCSKVSAPSTRTSRIAVQCPTPGSVKGCHPGRARPPARREGGGQFERGANGHGAAADRGGLGEGVMRTSASGNRTTRIGLSNIRSVSIRANT